MTAKLVNGSPGAAGMNMRVSLNEDVTGMFDSGKFSQVVADGSFSGLSLGQYVTKQITIDGVSYNCRAYLVDADYYYGGYNNKAVVGTHHVAALCVIKSASDNSILRHVWNPTNTTDGAIVSSSIYDFVDTKVQPAILSAFGEEHLVKNSKLLTTATSSGKSSSWAWKDDKYAEIPNCMMVSGASPSGSYFDVGTGFRELALFEYVMPYLLFGNNAVWLRDVFTDGTAAGLDSHGLLGSNSASSSFVVAPLILLR